MSDKRDKGGNLVTDYSRSNIDPVRAKQLNLAELDYVNGVWDEDKEEMWWPSYPSVAERHGLPIHVVQEQAAKHRWNSRREQRKSQMIAFQNEQTRKRWLEEDRVIMGILRNNIAQTSMTIARLVDEHNRLIKKALKEEAERRAEGEEDPIVRVPIRVSEAEALVRASETAAKAEARLAARISGLSTEVPELAPPKLIQTVEQEEAERAAKEEEAMPQSTLLDIYKEMRAIEEARHKKSNIILEGELVTDEDEAVG